MLLGVALSLSCDVAVVTSLWTPTPPPIITAHPLKGTPVGYSVPRPSGGAKHDADI